MLTLELQAHDEKVIQLQEEVMAVKLINSDDILYFSYCQHIPWKDPNQK